MIRNIHLWVTRTCITKIVLCCIDPYFLIGDSGGSTSTLDSNNASITKGNNFLKYGCRQLTHFGIFQDRILNLSGWAWFMISWSLSKFELISTTFFFKVSKGGTKGKILKNQLAIFQHFSFGPPLKKSCINELKFWEALFFHSTVVFPTNY